MLTVQAGDLADDVAPCVARSYKRSDLFVYATTLVLFTGFPAHQQRGDALYYASYSTSR